MTHDPLAAVEAAAGLAVLGAPATAARRGRVDSRLAGLDAGPSPLAFDRGLLPRLAELRDELGDVDHVILAGPGRAARAIARTLGHRLTILDHPDPRQLLALIRDRDLMCRSVTVLAAEGTDDLRRVLLRGYIDLGLTEARAARHLLAMPEAPVRASLFAAALAGCVCDELCDKASE